MKTLLASLAILLAALYGSGDNFHSFSIEALNSDQKINFNDFKGKKILVVNVASKCGYTKQYSDLQKLYEQYGDKLIVVGFPCDQFAGQELDSENLIQDFCKKNYGVTFPMTQIIEVKGEGQHPIYSFLTSKTQNGIGDYQVKWNFNKFLIDENGDLIKYFPSGVKPLDEEIVSLL
ncbi:glutathione peroxidase [Reichenbachiella versicolor]|uniref:glutathione peroxidase n=1 Tax=Reichenbachiella versicolor TaxID=1821036 RepID=UPI001C881B4C|nr:glutathione peroxidase [Reichenbachiella versicolor]